MSDILGRGVPSSIKGYGRAKPFAGAFQVLGPISRAATVVRCALPGVPKILPSVRAALDACELRDGATISFHHHLRNGDRVLNLVLSEITAKGLRDIRVAASALFPVHAPLVDHIHREVVSGLAASTIYGPLADAISRGELARPVLMYTHGGRARCIESGALHIDVAFVAAPTADGYGNLNGVNGRAACGPLGYAASDVQYADRVVAITDNLVPYPATPIEISQDYVDFIVEVDSIGDPEQIVSGTTRLTTNPLGLQIAQTAASIIEASGLLREGFSFQTGAGGVSLAAAAYLRDIMVRRKVQGSFASGGITGGIVQMFDAGLFRALLDVQAFDLEAVASYRRSPAHHSMSASMYANPHNRGCVVNQLDAVILGAAEIDVAFNVNVTTGNGGMILGGSGGHADTAAGSKLTLITTQLTAGRVPKIVDRVKTLTTPGESVDAVVTEAGVAVNPRRTDLLERLKCANVPLVSIEYLREAASRKAGPPKAVSVEDSRIVAVVEYRDGTVIDVVRAVPKMSTAKTWREDESPDRG
ncbi:citrate lyase subunit alpha / citrate CoA-transferase [Bradyrhizobium sp. Ghvi]|uniref:citrate lyase subunit alpha n=1 Tax=Bradyrhizobium sp. Ghvi TaxID=1855319 RepID=UPI0008DF28C5|nr:citrate lyase subunit alpha [Bradyrhizobium sp. Ghvi]SFP77049.1 citrate lyase subunit alpha / citrate CoA-transferase [Bradyrhizobium sp. Ghvi]